MTSTGEGFLVLDVDVESTEDVSALVADLSQDAFVVSDDSAAGHNRVTFELNDVDGDQDINTQIERFAGLLESLSPRGAAIWSASTRIFNVGVGRTSAYSVNFAILPATLELIVRAGASLVVTIYQDDHSSTAPRGSKHA